MRLAMLACLRRSSSFLRLSSSSSRFFSCSRSAASSLAWHLYQNSCSVAAAACLVHPANQSTNARQAGKQPPFSSLAPCPRYPHV